MRQGIENAKGWRYERACVQRITECLMRFQHKNRVRREWKIIRNGALKMEWSQLVDYGMAIIAIKMH